MDVTAIENMGLAELDLWNFFFFSVIPGVETN